MESDHISAAKQVMKAIKKRMDDIAELNKIKNDVESHVFQTRDSLEYDDSLKQVSTEEQKDEIRKSLSDTEEWLWDDHELKDYRDKLKELRKQMKPLITRKSELQARPEALKFAHDQIKSIKDYLQNETAMADVHPNETAIIEGYCRLRRVACNKEKNGKAKLSQKHRHS